MRITYVMMLLFFGMIGYFIYFDGVTSKEVINNPHNSRLAKMADSVVRGEILSADGEVLAESTRMTMAIITVIIRMDVHLPMWWEQVM